MRHAYHCHASPAVLGSERSTSERNGERSRVEPLDQFDTVRCPCCRFPLIARMGRHGPYFHCRCSEEREVRRGVQPISPSC